MNGLFYALFPCYDVLPSLLITCCISAGLKPMRDVNGRITETECHELHSIASWGAHDCVCTRVFLHVLADASHSHHQSVSDRRTLMCPLCRGLWKRESWRWCSSAKKGCASKTPAATGSLFKLAYISFQALHATRHAQNLPARA